MSDQEKNQTEEDTEGQKVITGPSWTRTTPRARSGTSRRTTPRASASAAAVSSEDDTEGQRTQAGSRPRTTPRASVQAADRRGRHRGPAYAGGLEAEDDTEGQVQATRCRRRRRHRGPRAKRAADRPRTTPRASGSSGRRWPRTTPRASTVQRPLDEDDTEGQRFKRLLRRGRHRGPEVQRPLLDEDDTEGQRATAALDEDDTEGMGQSKKK